MVNSLHPGHLLLFALTGWINRQQQAAIDYLREENRVLSIGVGLGAPSVSGQEGGAFD